MKIKLSCSYYTKVHIQCSLEQYTKNCKLNLEIHKGIVKMSHKKRYTCDIFYYILARNFVTNYARAMKLDMILENHINVHMIK